MAVTKLAVLGNPIAHSLSPVIHEAFARQAGLDIRYEKVLVPQGRFAETVQNLIDKGLLGFNITLPFKYDAFRFADEHSVAAQRSQAVNTISLVGGQIYGDNTDGRGLVRDLVINLGWPIENQKVLVLGAGGAVSAVIWDLLQGSPDRVDLHNRTLSKAIALADRQRDPRVKAVDRDHLDKGYDLIINGTSAGLSAETPDVPESIVAENTRCYDMMYATTQTTFNAWGLTNGAAAVSDGTGMLVEQAALSFELWFSVKAGTAGIIATLRSE